MMTAEDWEQEEYRKDLKVDDKEEEQEEDEKSRAKVGGKKEEKNEVLKAIIGIMKL